MIAGWHNFTSADTAACLTIFDTLCPAYFASNERDEFAEYLSEQGDEYQIFRIEDGATLAGYGLHHSETDRTLRLNWIMVSPEAQGQQLGDTMMKDALAVLHASSMERLLISASQHSAPFFSRYGAIEQTRIPNGWGLGMHRVEMVISS